jgi:hypothetical protein
MRRRPTIELMDRMIEIAKMDPNKNEAEWDFFHRMLWGERKNDNGIMLDLLIITRRMLIWKRQATNVLARLQGTK